MDTSILPRSGNDKDKRAEKTGLPLVDFSKVSKVYGVGRAQVIAMDEVDLAINEGEFVAIMGPSGSGKSTCLNLIGCLDTPSSGSYRFKGVAVGGLSRNQRALLRRHYLGFIFQGYNLLKRTTAIENVEMPLVYRGYKKSVRQKMSLTALKEVGLEGREHHTPAQLSGGEQQRVAIARAIATNPSLLLADEPTGNLDSKKGSEIMDLLTKLNQDRGITIIMVTHERAMAEYADRTVHFLDGRISNIQNNRVIHQ
ncbi:putative ABC transport system ATP-binding protein [Fodinibius roseus]|uniref:Putative ABC transport system ATP-binding protein n=1 Tax=Fodinibius roseus TaxID=1194090 RepID=A0A1M4X735_9BACT|nr:ABC transporter ATP-binding protein [Fodinibius roseus]SHE89261.1 putative ABC transport system ATP-binding protein [Fodinibius roseus]